MPPRYVGAPTAWQHCTPIAAYLPGLPTSAGAMRGYLERTQQVTIGDTVAEVDNDWATTSTTCSGTTYLTPRQLAAMYDFMASTPGFTVVPDAVRRGGTARSGDPLAGQRWAGHRPG